MPRFRVTETQTVRYTWFVEAADHDAAMASAQDGVPDDADSKLLQALTDAEEDDG